MAVLTIRNGMRQSKPPLRVQAARRVPMEEARRILRDALSRQEEQMPLGQRLAAPLQRDGEHGFRAARPAHAP